MKKSLKQFIFEEMEKKGCVLDSELSRFQNHEPNYCQAEVYKREYQMLEAAKNQFDDCEDKVIYSYKNSYKWAKTRYSLRYKGMAENHFYKIPKIYFNYLKEKGIKEE